MRFFVCFLILTLSLSRQSSAKRLSCRKMTTKQKCEHLRRCKWGFPSLKVKCEKRFGKVPRKAVDNTNAIETSDRTELFSAKILSGPANTTSPPGGRAMFTCTVSGSPAPITSIAPVSASVDAGNIVREEIQANGLISRVKVTNIISPVTRADEGWYRCSTQNVYGGEKSDAYLLVVDLCAGVECSSPDTICVPDYIALSASCQCRDYCKERNYYTLNPVCGTDCQTHFNLCSLEYAACQQGGHLAVLHHGSCHAGPVYLEAANQLYIAGYPGPLLFYTNDLIVLECIVRGSTLINWYKLYPGERVLLVKTGSTLRMERALVDDSALYQCAATDCLMTVSSQPVEVIVTQRLQPLTRSQLTGPVCSVFGSSRVLTFDGYSYSLNYSPCAYVLAMECSEASWLVYGRTSPCGNLSAGGAQGHPPVQGGACLESVTFYVGGDVITLLRGWVVTRGRRGDKVLISEGREVVVGELVITFDGLYVRVTLGEQVTIRWDGVSVVLIQLSHTHVYTCGLCGDNDSNHDNEISSQNMLHREKGEVDVKKFVSSWKVDSEGLCHDGTPTRPHCTNQDLASQKCEEVFSADMFRACNDVVEVTNYREACVQDLCQGSHVLDDVTLPVPCYVAGSYLAMCRLYLPLPATLYKLGCPSTRYLQQFTVSIGCPQDTLPFNN